MRPNRDGFTLVELLIALTVGLILVLASLTFAISTFQGAEGNKLREEIYRSSRFIGMSLQRDVQRAGVGIESKADFGTLSTFSDTVVILSVPWTPQFASVHDLVPPVPLIPPGINPLLPGGTCGLRCLDLAYDAGGGFDLQPGDIARLQVNAERRLLLITGVRDIGTRFQVDFLAGSEILHHAAGLSGGLQLDRYGTTVQELSPIVYFEQDSILYRAQSFDSTGALQPSPMAYGVVEWDAWLIFTDMDVATAADPTDADVTNDFDDLLGVRIATTLATNRMDIRVNDGLPFTRAYEWRIMPRNLMYERNR